MRACVETRYACAWKLVVSVRVWKLGMRARGNQWRVCVCGNLVCVRLSGDQLARECVWKLGMSARGNWW